MRDERMTERQKARPQEEFTAANFLRRLDLNYDDLVQKLRTIIAAGAHLYAKGAKKPLLYI
jgi:hypothetical protein